MIWFHGKTVLQTNHFETWQSSVVVIMKEKQNSKFVLQMNWERIKFGGIPQFIQYGLSFVFLLETQNLDDTNI